MLRNKCSFIYFNNAYVTLPIQSVLRMLLQCGNSMNENDFAGD